MFRDRVIQLTTPEEVSEFLAAHPTSVVFKAGTCHKTMQGFGVLQERVAPRDDLYVGLIRVIEARAASNAVAERTGIRHESPQVILFRDGEPVFDVDNWSITPDALAEGFARMPEPEGGPAADQEAASDLRPYLDVLERYLAGVMDDRQFEYVYTNMFRDDASLRSRDEVEVLSSIFGDVDQHRNMHLMMAGRSDTSQVRQRAEAAYQRLLSLA